MTSGKQNRVALLILYILVALGILFLAIYFWNKKDIEFTITPLLILIISLACLTYLFIYARKITDPKGIEERIQQEVEKARSSILADFESRDEEVINKTADIDERINKIVPKGKFKNAEAFANKLLVNFSNELQASLGAVYLLKAKKYSFLTGFALTGDEPPADFKSGENLNGQAAKSKEIMIIQDIPDDYFNIESGLGKSKPKTLIIVPILHNKGVIGIIEIATFIKEDEEILLELLRKTGKLAGEKIVQIQKS